MVRAHDELGVDKDVAAEDEGGQGAVDELGGGAVGQEHGDEAEEYEAPEGAKEVRHPRGEVVLGLEGERGQEDKHASSQEDSVEHDRRVVKGHDHGDGVCLEQREAAEEEQVGGVRFALPVGQEHHAHGAEEL